MAHVLVVCARKYNGHELWTSLGILQERGHTFDLVSTGHVIRDEITMQPNRIKELISDVTYDPDKYNGFMVVSGNMKDTELYWTHKEVLAYVNAANEANHSIAAICCSVPTVRYAAEGKRVSFFPLVRSREHLSRAGAILQTVALTRDQNLVTAEHQMASEMWAIEFANMLEGKPQEFFFKDSGYVPMGKTKRHLPELEALMEKRNGNQRSNGG
jgi:putative intracellular protease/amidase